MKIFNREPNYDKFESKKDKKSASSKKSKSSVKLNKIPVIGRLATFVKEIGTNKELASKIFFTLFIVVIYRGLSSIPLPGVDMAAYREFFGSSTTSEASFVFNLFTGGNIDSPSIVGLGIVIYIQASIMIQMLTPVIPKLYDLSKEGERGSQVLNQYTRYLTAILSFIYSIPLILLISQRDLRSTDGVTQSENPLFLIPHELGGDWPTITKVLFMAIVLSAGSLLVMWLAEIITEKGIGNGSSVIISVGILAALPSLLKQDFSSVNISEVVSKVLEGTVEVLTSPNILAFFGVVVGLIAMVILIIFVSESTRKIKIQYARRVRGSEGEASNLPLKLTVAGVMPVIFATSFLSIPQLIVPVLQRVFSDSATIDSIASSLEQSFLFATADDVVNSADALYIIIEFLLILLFGVFYAVFVVFKPKDTAENLQKNGAFVPGIRPGKATEKYITNVLLRIAFAGSIFLAVIALIPLVSRNIIQESANLNIVLLSGIGGTSILIVVSVILDTIRQYNSLKVSRSYERYSRQRTLTAQ